LEEAAPGWPDAFVKKMPSNHGPKRVSTFCQIECWTFSTKNSLFAFILVQFKENFPNFDNSPNLGPMLWFLKYFRRKIQRKMAFLTQNKAKLYKNLIITLVFKKNANFFAENCRKSQKIVENRRKLWS
jgi:hypothetical protein